MQSYCIVRFMHTMTFSKDGKMWELPDAFYRVSIKLIVKNPQDELLVLKENSTGQWELPGGGLDHGETIRQTVEREVREELSVQLSSLSETAVVTEVGMHPDNYATVKIYYRATLSSYDFIHEDGFESKFVTESEFLQLPMAGDESPIQKHATLIWQKK